MQFLWLTTIFILVELCSSDSSSSQKSRHISNRILGGTRANTQEGNYQASLRQHGIHYCGGAIIRPTWIITAAHCVLGKDPSEVTVMVGSKQLDGLDGRIHSAAQLFAHEHFDPIKPRNDIGLLKTQHLYYSATRFIRYSFRVTILMTWQLMRSWQQGGGLVDNVFQTRPNNLQKIHLKIQPLEKCKKDFEFISESHICTLTTYNEGVCQGDSGGPLTYKNILIGIVSFGEPCAKGISDVYTRVKYFKPWIYNIIDRFPNFLSMPHWPYVLER